MHVGCRAEPWTLRSSTVSAVEPGRLVVPAGVGGGGPSRCVLGGGDPSWAVAQTERVKQLAKLGKAHKFLLINEWMNSVPYSMNVVWR